MDDSGYLESKSSTGERRITRETVRGDGAAGEEESATLCGLIGDLDLIKLACSSKSFHRIGEIAVSCTVWAWSKHWPVSLWQRY